MGIGGQTMSAKDKIDKILDETCMPNGVQIDCVDCEMYNGKFACKASEIWGILIGDNNEV